MTPPRFICGQRAHERQRGQTTSGYVAIIAIMVIALFAGWDALATAIHAYYERFAFALGLPVT